MEFCLPVPSYSTPYHKDGDVIVAAGNVLRKEVVTWIMYYIPA